MVDSDILIDFFRDYEKARKFLLESKEKLLASRVSVMEVVLGVKTKIASVKAMKQLKALGIEVVEINGSISETAGKVFEENWHKWGIGIIDSFVAATALNLDGKLATRNEKHFKPIAGLDLIVPY